MRFLVSLEWILFGLRVISTVILYSFLGIAFYLIWRELKQAATPPQFKYQLRVLAANGNEAWVVGEALPLQPVTLLGRDAKNTIVLHDASASARHACLTQTGGVWWLESLDSSNGTMLNELPLSKPTPLTEGDIIGIGSLRLKLEVGSKE